MPIHQQTMLGRQDLNETDQKILNLLCTGRVSPPYVSDKLGISREYASDRLIRLKEHGHVNRIAPGLYELHVDPLGDKGVLKFPFETDKGGGFTEVYLDRKGSQEGVDFDIRAVFDRNNWYSDGDRDQAKSIEYHELHTDDDVYKVGVSFTWRRDGTGWAISDPEITAVMGELEASEAH